MSIRLACELLRSFELTMAGRLRVIEDLILQEDSSQRVDSNKAIDTIPDFEEKLLKLTNLVVNKLDDMERRMAALEQAKSPVVKDDRPVEAVQAELEEEIVQAAALDADIDASEVEVKAKKALTKAVEILPKKKEVLVEVEEELEEEVVEEEVVEEEVVEEEVVEEEVVEEEVEEEVVEEEVVEEEVVEEEEEEQVESLEEFEYKGRTYYHDSDLKVYIPDEDGAVSDPIGIWDPVKKTIRRLT
jgi:hypothetical protein